jgi:hypothetical protein
MNPWKLGGKKTKKEPLASRIRESQPVSESLGDQPINQSINILSHNQRLLHVSVGSLFSLVKKTTVRLLGSADHDRYGSHAYIRIAAIEAVEPIG